MLESIRAATAAAVPKKRMGARENMGGGFRTQAICVKEKLGVCASVVCVCANKGIKPKGVFAKSFQAHKNRKSTIERDTLQHFLVTSSPALQPPPILTLM